MTGHSKTSAIVSRRAKGVTVLDDWDGFGQILTGSGTATFVDVSLEPDDVVDTAAVVTADTAVDTPAPATAEPAVGTSVQTAAPLPAAKRAPPRKDFRPVDRKNSVGALDVVAIESIGGQAILSRNQWHFAFERDASACGVDDDNLRAIGNENRDSTERADRASGPRVVSNQRGGRIPWPSHSIARVERCDDRRCRQRSDGCAVRLWCGTISGVLRPATRRCGDENQRKKYLPKLATGEWVGCFGLT